VVRSLFGAAFPVGTIGESGSVRDPSNIFDLAIQLFGNQMYTAMNPRIASTVLGAASLLLVPVPFLLLKWGPALRRRSRYAMEVLPLNAPHTQHPAQDVEKGKGTPDIKA
jgi:hypothetical protein